jgi:hypothetical protein
MRGLQQIQTMQEIQQFVKVWQLVREVQFSDAQDEINWPLTQDGKYSTRSAYTAQFLGFFADNNWGRLWTVKAENKCKVWAWLILQNKLKIVDRIIKNGGSANPVCQFCYTQ